MMPRHSSDPELAARQVWIATIGELAERTRARRATEDGARSPLAHDCQAPAAGVDGRPFCCGRAHLARA